MARIPVASLVSAVKGHAHAHYNDGKAWDYVVECLSDADIEELVCNRWSVNGAIKAVNDGYCKVVREEINNCRFD